MIPHSVISNNNKTLCIAYAAGPGDIVNTFSFWQQGVDDQDQITVTYSGLFFDACRALNARGIVISSCPRVDSIRTEEFYIINLPKGIMKSGLAYHLQQILYLRKVIKIAIKEGADILVMADATGHFFPFLWFAPSSMQIIPTLHCKPWSPYKPISITQSLINKLNKNIFSSRAKAILSASLSIDNLVHTMTNNITRPIYHFLPLYRKNLFKSVLEPNRFSNNFNLLFAGRVELEKGVFDLLKIAEMLNHRGYHNIFFHICGNGSCEDKLRQAVIKNNLENNFILHGYCNQEQMIIQINNSHAFIVPTKTTFEEGFNQVVAEAVLSGRPVITSAVCPALEYVRDAVIEVPPDDINGYLSAIIKLFSDKQFYHDKQANTLKLQEQFYDHTLSWQASLENIIKDL